MMRSGKKIIKYVALAAGIGFIVYGLIRGEGGVVLGKAITVCLQCIGIG